MVGLGWAGGLGLGGLACRLVWLAGVRRLVCRPAFEWLHPPFSPLHLSPPAEPLAPTHPSLDPHPCCCCCCCCSAIRYFTSYLIHTIPWMATPRTPQGYDEPFLEQWHQKLHTNTSPDDIAICEAYLAFLHRWAEAAGEGIVDTSPN